MFKHMALLFFITSCALFRGEPSLTGMNKEELLQSVKLTGEGRGRLTLGESQYVFGVDSVLNETNDWIMAVQIPLHGEEVMILPDLTKKRVANEETDSFEERIEREFRRLALHKIISAEEFIQEMRSIIRFVLAPEWKGKRNCVAQKQDTVCELDGEKFLLSANEKEFTIKKTMKAGVDIQIVAKNLTKSFFGRTDIRLHSETDQKLKREASSFSLELFW